MKQQHYYRPEWMCGRYNKPHNVAILYNLIEGKSFFFENHSAQVIGEILKTPRKGEIHPENIARSTGIHPESICEFMGILRDARLVTDTPPTPELVRAMRLEQKDRIKNRQHEPKKAKSTDALPYDITSAEQEYNKAVADEFTITSVMFELTYNCSERCIHCYNAGAIRSLDEHSHRNRQEMDLEDYKRVIDELHDMGVYKVCLSGGDPFSKPIVWEIIDYLYRKEIAFDIYTNGITIGNTINTLIDYFPRLVGLSIYSAIPETHDRVTRVKGSYLKTMTVAKQLADAGVNMAFKCVVFKTNVKSYYSVIELAEEYGAIPQIEVNLCNGVDGDTSIIDNLRLPTDVMEIVLRDPHSPLYVGVDTPSYNGIPKDPEQHPCGAGETTFTITPEGYLTPCVGFPARLGNLRTQTIRNIISTSETLRIWRKSKIMDIAECGTHDKCAYCYLCVGNAYIEHGNILQPATCNCEMAEMRYRLAQKLRRGEDPLQGMSVAERLQQVEVSEVGEFHKHIIRNFRNEEFTLK